MSIQFKTYLWFFLNSGIWCRSASRIIQSPVVKYGSSLISLLDPNSLWHTRFFANNTWRHNVDGFLKVYDCKSVLQNYYRNIRKPICYVEYLITVGTWIDVVSDYTKGEKASFYLYVCMIVIDWLDWNRPKL